MTLFDIVRNLQAIAAQEPSVRSVSDGDIYDALNAAVDIKYGVFHITQDTHTTNGDLDVWGLNLFFIDRLLDNGENRLSIQSAGITILENVLKRFADTFGAEYMNNIVYTPFTQRFKDNCAGVFCKISISTVMDNLCAEGGKIVLVKNQDKSIDITSNGRYNVTPDYGFSGLGSVDINVDVQGGGCVASEETKTYTANGTYTITPTSGDCISKATVTVNVPSEEPVLQQKTIDIAENGSYSLVPDAGVDGLNRVDINVDVPPVPITPNLQSKSIEITENGNTIITPADGYDGLSQVEVITNVLTALQSKTIDITENGSYDVSPDMSAGFVGLAGVGINVNVPTTAATAYVVPNEMCFGSSKYTTFDATGLDFSQKTDFSDCWISCSSFTSFPQLDLSSGTNFQYAWFQCSSLTEFPALDLHNGTNFSSAWNGCNALTSIENVNVSNGTDFQRAWYNCKALTSFPMIDVHNGTNFNLAWYGCSNLTSFPALDLSKGTDFEKTWAECNKLTSLPALDVHNGTNFSYAWYHCDALASIGQLDLSSGTNFNGTWVFCQKLTTLSGFGAIKESIWLNESPKLTVESLMNVINQAADLNELGITGKKMIFGSTNLAKLTDAQKAVATSKGWSLT